MNKVFEIVRAMHTHNTFLTKKTCNGFDAGSCLGTQILINDRCFLTRLSI